MAKGTALDSIARRDRLYKGYPTKDPKTGKITVTKEPPKTSRTAPKKAGPSTRDAALKRSATRHLYREK